MIKTVAKQHEGRALPVRSHLEFVSDVFPPNQDEGETINPGLFGENLARFLAEQLPLHGFRVTRVHPEDWGWRIQLESAPFDLWIGCGHQDGTDNGFLCFIEPSKPYIRKWLRKFDTRQTIERLADAMQLILVESGSARELRWWSEAEVRT